MCTCLYVALRTSVYFKLYLSRSLHGAVKKYLQFPKFKIFSLVVPYIVSLKIKREVLFESYSVEGATFAYMHLDIVANFRRLENALVDN